MTRRTTWLALLCTVAALLVFAGPATLRAQAPGTPAAPAVPAAPPKITAPPAIATTPEEDAKHYVFAHYMVCFFSSVEFYKQEMELAQRHGIDGFALNSGNWANYNPATGDYQPENYTRAAENMYEAAKQLNSGFKLFISPDLNTLGGGPKIQDMIRRFYTHPNQFRHKGKAVLSGWAGGPDNYAGPIKQLNDEGYQVCFVPFVFNPRYAMATSIETVERYFIGHPWMDGYFDFAADGSLSDVLRSNADSRRATLLLDKVFMAGLTPTYNSANLRDWHGMEGYGSAWRGIINDSADWVELVTWNDYQEDSNLMPFRWPAGSEKPYFVRDESFLDVTEYYANWYKTGVQPTITQDKVYYTYRNRSKWTRQAYDSHLKKWVDLTTTAWPYDQMHDDVGDNIYVDTFLTAPSVLTVEIGGDKKKFDMGAGVGHAEVPIKAGVPHFTLTRDDAKKPVLDFIGRKLIIDKPTELDSDFGMHLANRTWTGAAVAGPVTRLEAATGTLSEGATVVKDGDASAVENLEKAGSGFSVPLKGLATAAYNVRITYANTAKTEARLTLASDGPPHPDKTYPYFIPALLPPTDGKYKTVSVLWSLYDKSSYLKLSWEPRSIPSYSAPGGDDYGTVPVASIELVKVDPAKIVMPPANAAPEMVDIPGGSFKMGGEGGEPDELPGHKVTLAPFLMAKNLVTNAEFEKFDPNHRQFRDSYSWRDREPVIYVGWNDAAKYCNWLSKQEGLTPAYEERPIGETKQTRLEANLKVNGYRLPTEAEWEYVASGRGEGRKYPWGKEEPGPAYGNIAGAASVKSNMKLRSNEAAGVSIVGSFPANASRDGVLDLSGNACQWCSDWFHPYAAEDQTNPYNDVAAVHRNVRGGSWGYYNNSQRSADREFQNPNYPGYIYIGFRVVRTK